MSRSRYDEDLPMEPRKIPLASIVVILPVVLIVLGWLGYSYTVIDVPKGKVVVLIKKTGKDLTNGQEIAPSLEYKGVQREMLGPGRHFRNPYFWDWEVHDEVSVPEDKFGVKIRLAGNVLDYGQLIVDREDQEGIVREVLKPARYAINPYLETVEYWDPVVVPAGYLGVVTNLTGPMPENPNVLLVESGKRGVQKETLSEGRYLRNPYVERIHLIDCRSQRFNLAEHRDMGFPSKDGFWVRLAGIVEFRVLPEKAAEVFVLYNEAMNEDRVDEELITKIILPNARSFCRLEGSNSLGRDFIQGTTRSKFQENFQTSMREACQPLGIEIIQALITNIYPPEPIAKPVREREIAKQNEKQYQQQILQQKSEINLAIEKALVKQKTAIVQADQEVIRVTTEALREQEVAVTKAQESLAVATFKLDAAKDEAAAVLSRGKAKAEVVKFENAAAAAGWQKAVEAFDGNGSMFAQYVMYQKMASAYRNIMVNTADSPMMKIFEGFTEAAVRSSPMDSSPPSFWDNRGGATTQLPPARTTPDTSLRPLTPQPDQPPKLAVPKQPTPPPVEPKPTPTETTEKKPEPEPEVKPPTKAEVEPSPASKEEPPKTPS